MRKRRPGAVVLDLVMPGVDGMSVLQHMQADPRLHGIPVIVVTGRSQEGALTAEYVTFARRTGLSVGEMMQCVKSGLDALHSVAPTGSGRLPPAASPGSPA